VILVTEYPILGLHNLLGGATPMPVLMIALLALAVFGVIGGLLTAAVVLETKKANANEETAKTSVGKSSA
jgi:hypothetical protein